MPSVPSPQPAALFGIHPDELAVFCRVFRRLRGMSLRQVGIAAGVSFSTISRVENGKTGLTVESYVTLVTWLAGEVQPK